ncbi:(2Fe-2S)-binding protein [Aurantiacibacter suaedae]|uniref:(2Fe-2S)-binding protein n=1 Tax=Aurantiacibacter suaedae TaxID=2545755 RepID=UPI0010F8AD6D|nr:(2Fe-2S)-binding protein [Aurantiacibacter suaedae]
MSRIERGVTRPEPITIVIDGETVPAFSGETVAVAILARDQLRFRDDRSGRARGMFCNMGTCGECTVWVGAEQGAWERLRACLVPVRPGLEVCRCPPEDER